MNTVKERIKTVMLIVLACGAVFMAYSTWFFDSPTGDGAIGLIAGDEAANAGGEYSFGTDLSDGMRPIRISVKKSSGRVGAEYSHSAVDGIYANTRGLMAEAMSVQSGKWQSVKEDAWRKALTWQGVLYDYQGIVRADVLSGWLWGGQSEVGSIKGRYLLLTVNPDTRDILFMIKNPDSGEIYAGKTQIDGETVLNVIEQVAAPECVLACESGVEAHGKLNPECFVKSSALPGIINGYNVCESFNQEMTNTLIKSFGFTPYSVSEHVENDGTKVYIEGSSTVRIENDGFIVYMDTDASADAQQGLFVSSASGAPTDADIFETARALVERLKSIAGGEGRLYPRDFRYFKDENCWVADFGWSVNGVPVDRQETGYSARVVISNMRVIEADFYMRAYHSTDRPGNILSKNLAMAAVTQDNSSLELRYTDAGRVEIEPGWYIKNKQK